MTTAQSLCFVAAALGAPIEIQTFMVEVLGCGRVVLLLLVLLLSVCCPWFAFVVAGVKWSDKCFCPYRTPGRCGNYKGHGTPLPFCAEVFFLAAAARGIGTDGDCCCKSVHRVEPSIPWLWVRQMALRLTWPAVCGPGADRVARSADSTRFELVTLGWHQLRPLVRPGKLGQFALGLALGRALRDCSS